MKFAEVAPRSDRSRNDLSVAINFILAKAWATDPATETMGRSWVGWDPARTADELWETNRGVWRLSAQRMAKERFATLSYGGVVQVVARIEGAETFQDHGAPKTALVGPVLPDNHPVAAALLGRAVPAQRNPVVYLDTREVDDMGDVAARPSPARSHVPEGFLLTYNPDRWTWDEAEVATAVAVTRSGRSYKGDWATGIRSSGIEPGDRAFLLRQGREPRGIVAAGTFRSRIGTGPHFDTARAGEATYALVNWDTVLEPAEILPVSVLQDAIPEHNWTPLGGGTSLPPAVLDRLEAVWSDHVRELGRGEVAPPRRGGQGWEKDPLRRKVIEKEAQARLMRCFDAADGWLVVDTHAHHPYDAIATRGGETWYLEAKGTVTAGETVLVTRGEVEHARAHRGECVMGVLSGVEFDGDDVIAGSGSLRVYDWDPDAGALTPVTFSYAPGRELNGTGWQARG